MIIIKIYLILVKSSVTYKDQQSPVESLVHTSGLKNFADTGISSSVSAGLDKTNDGIYCHI